jgi:hypothetical protein
MQRPELSFGSVEYAGTKDYCKVGKGSLQVRRGVTTEEKRSVKGLL